MKILVTGGAGFIGSNLVGKLLADGHYVVCFDNFNSFYDPNIKERNIAEFKNSDRFELVRGDIMDTELLGSVFSNAQGLDAVVHLAARAGVRPSIKDPGLYVDVNVQGTVNILEQMRCHGIKRCIFASSSSVYGVNKAPFCETDPVFSPVSPYAATKIAGESMCRVYSQLYGIKTVCLRFFTVYGPRQRPEMAIHKFTRLIDQGKSIDVYGNGQSSRDYTYVDDIVEGVVRCLELESSYEIINLGNSHPTSLIDLIRNIEDRVGKKANLRFVADQAGDVPVTYADTSKAEKLLGFAPKVCLGEGLDRFISYFRSLSA